MDTSDPKRASTGSEAFPLRAWRLAPVLVVLAAAAVPYAAAIHHGFVWDDHLIIRHIDNAAERGGLIGVLAAPFLPTPDVPNNYYRPVVYATYWFDRTLGGGLPQLAHLSNVLLHALVTLLVFVLTHRLLGDGVGALAAALLFATHPIHVENVAWVAGRTDILCALFLLGSALAWSRAVSLPPERGRRLHLALSGFLFVLACLSKELAIALPLLLVLLPSQDSGAPTEVRLRRRVLEPAWILTFLPAAVVVLLARQAVLYDELGHVGLQTQLRGSILVQEPLVAVSALIRMLRSLLVPWPHSAIITRSDVGIDAVTLMSIAALAAITAISVRAYPRAVAFAAAWIAAFALPSLLVPGGGVIVAAERYAYVPSVGAAVVLGALAASRGALRGVTPEVRRAAAGVVALGLAAASFGRVPVWASDATLSADMVKTSPETALAHQIRAEVLLGTSRLDEAITSYRRAASLDPQSAPLHHSLGRTLMRAGDAASAVSAFRRATYIEPDWAEPRVGLAVACATMGDWSCVEEQRRALIPYPEDLARLDRIIGRGGR